MPLSSEDPAVRAKRPWIVLGFAALTAGLIVARALGHAVDYELIILSGSIAGLDSVRSLVAQAGAAAVRKRSEPPAAVAPVAAPEPTAQDVAAARAEAVTIADIVAGLGGGGGMRPLREPLPYPRDEPASGLVDLLTVESLAPALYGVWRETACRSTPVFSELPRAGKEQWHTVADLVLDLIHGDESGTSAVLYQLTAAAGGYVDPDSDPPSPVEADDDGPEGDDERGRA